MAELISDLDSGIQTDFYNDVFTDVDYICGCLDTMSKEELEYVIQFCQRLISTQ